MTERSTLLPSVFDYSDYKSFVRDWVLCQPHNGRGQYRRMAQHLRVHTTLLSHVFRGSKELTPEQACGLATFFAFDGLDAEYLLALVELSRAGTRELQNVLGRRIAALREKHQQVEHRVPGARTLSRDEQTVFYSQWYYSAIRLAAALPNMVDAEAIAARLALPPELVRDALRFLSERKLVIEDAAGYKLGTKRTHLGAGSPLAAAHHRNWRVRAMARYEQMSSSEFAFTSPIALSRADALRIRELLVETVAKVAKVVEPSECEELHMLNIDWLEI